MKRAIVDYKKLTKDILALLVEKYPEGYQDRDVIRFKNAKNETVEALEVRTEDTIYLVKVSTRLATSMERYDEDEDDYYSDTLEMSREDEIALKRKKDISKASLHIDDDEEEEEEEEEHYRDDYHDQREDDDDDDDDEEDEIDAYRSDLNELGADEDLEDEVSVEEDLIIIDDEDLDSDFDEEEEE